MENLIKIKKLSKSKNLLNFLNERNYEDIKFVIEDFDEVDENYFKISRLETVSRFFENLSEEVKKNKDPLNFEKTIKRYLANEYDDIYKY
jgi:hypothetical protein